MQGTGSTSAVRGRLAKHRARARRSQTAFYVPRSELARNYFPAISFSHLANC